MKKSIFAGLALLWGGAATALETEFPCYELTSDEAAAILENEISFVQYENVRWDVVNVGWGLTCLEYCPAGFFEVSDIKFRKGKCIYTIKNLEPQAIVGECTTFTLKPRVVPGVCK